MYQALYRQYRPQTFDEVVGQDAVIRTLKMQLLSGKLSHAYLFTGSRGTGKTSIAKILAKAVNCLDPVDGSPCNRCAACRSIDDGSCMDVLEIDAASNNGVENVRDLRDDAIYSPAQVKKRVYIIDEVHMLSISAFNALLKIIEEPPAHLLFILATTELHKVPATIVSRCQRFAFRRLSVEEISSRIGYIAVQEGAQVEPEAARILGRLADGAMRDGINLLDQCLSGTDPVITAQRVYESLGLIGQHHAAELLEAVAAHDTRAALELFSRLYAEGKDIAAMLDELCASARDLLVVQTAPKSAITMLSGITTEDQARSLARKFTPAELFRIIGVLQQTMAGFTKSASRRMDAELCLMTLCDPGLQVDVQSLNARLSRLEERVATGQIPALPGTQAAPQMPEDEAPPPFDDRDAPPEDVREETELPPMPPVPDGFWVEVANRVRAELNPPVKGFFAPSPQAPVQGRLQADTLVLVCKNSFTKDVVNKPDVVSLVARKAQAVLGRPVRVKVVDRLEQPASNQNLDDLIAFGKAHEDIIKIKK